MYVLKNPSSSKYDSSDLKVLNKKNFNDKVQWSVCVCEREYFCYEIEINLMLLQSCEITCLSTHASLFIKCA